MRSGICMECGTEFDRVTQKHGAVECINGLKQKLANEKASREQWTKDAIERAERCSKLGAENNRMRETLIMLRAMLFEECDETNVGLLDLITHALGR